VAHADRRIPHGHHVFVAQRNLTVTLGKAGYGRHSVLALRRGSSAAALPSVAQYQQPFGSMPMSRTIAVQNGSEKANPATVRPARPASPRPSFPAEDTPGHRAAATRPGVMAHRRPGAIARCRAGAAGERAVQAGGRPARGGCPASRAAPGPALFLLLACHPLSVFPAVNKS
jgi:hypothetical protein